MLNKSDKTYLYFGNCLNDSFLIKKTGMSIESYVLYVKSNSNEILYVPTPDLHVFEKSKIQNVQGFPLLKTLPESLLDLIPTEDLIIPTTFPLKLFQVLEKGFKNIQVKDYPFISSYLYKNDQELKKILEHGRSLSNCFKDIKKFLTSLTIDGKFLYLDNKKCSVKDLRILIAKKLAEHSFQPCNIHIGVGDDTTHPHTQSKGFLQSGVPIVIDIYPKHLETNLYLDMTRTFIVGEPRFERLEELFQKVHRIKKLFENQIKDGVIIGDFYLEVKEQYQQEGIELLTPKEEHNNSSEFYCNHNLGHGIGYQYHEPPTITQGSKIPFENNMAVAFEPGVYYSTGGVRIEDTYIIQKGNSIKATNFEELLILR